MLNYNCNCNYLFNGDARLENKKAARFYPRRFAVYSTISIFRKMAMLVIHTAMYGFLTSPNAETADKRSTRLSAVCFEYFLDLFVKIARGANGAAWARSAV
jgi:hypothetical protein